jgi:alpha-tubulin suppressor-like RCC1 family protein
MRAILALVAVGCLSGCSLLFGVDDFRVGGPADGGGMDARVGDAGPRPDAAPVDAAPVDAAPVDAAPTDAAAHDGATADGPADAGGADAGTDAGGCAVSADCDDGDHCTADRCFAATCESTPDTLCVGAITGGGGFTCAMRNGRVHCWGQGSSGQLGIGTLVDTTSASIIPALTGVVAIATGNIHACALIDGGTVRCWGHNSSGQVAEGATNNQPTPFDVPSLTDAVQLGLGYRHSCALRSDGTVSCWGRNTAGQLGDRVELESGVPLPVPGIMGAVELGVGNDHACVRLADGTVRCWGARANGRLGDGGATTGFTGASVAVSGITDAVDLEVGEFHSCALLGDGTMACWGGGSSGALGDGSSADSARPTTVLDVAGAAPLRGVRQMALGSSHTCVLRDEGEVLCWGSNYYGELTGTVGVNRTRPGAVSGVTGAVFLGMGEQHSCALIAAGRDAVCWGRNRNGQLGDGTLVDSATPLAVSGI